MHVDAALLAALSGRPGEAIHKDLLEAIRSGLLMRAGDGYAFAHARVRQAAHLLVPEEERAPTHLKIGRLLLARTPPRETEGSVFEVVSHLNRAAHLIDDERELLELVELDLIAARKAKAANAYASALGYLASAAQWLGPRSFQEHYELAFPLALLRAESEFFSGNHEEPSVGPGRVRAGALQDRPRVGASARARGPPRQGRARRDGTK